MDQRFLIILILILIPGYTVVIKGWQAAQAQANMVSDSAFTAITYGLGSVESYGYNAGTLLII